jgi:hypothetical protein
VLDGDKIEQVLIYSDDYRHLKPLCRSLKAQVEHGRDINEGAFIKI